jgi:TPR repeat protein
MSAMRLVFMLAAIMAPGHTLSAPAAAQGQSYASLRSQAESGDAEAQYKLGMSYLTGLEIPKDEAKGAGWIKLAAEQGHVRAQYNYA